MHEEQRGGVIVSLSGKYFREAVQDFTVPAPAIDSPIENTQELIDFLERHDVEYDQRYIWK